MVTRAGRSAAAAVPLIVACAALAGCGSPQTPTEPGRSARTPTPVLAASPAPSPTPATAATPTPAPPNGSVFGYVTTSSGSASRTLPGVLVRLHQDGAEDQVTNSAGGSQEGYYAFCCLRPGPAVLTATFTGYFTFTASITVGEAAVRYDIRMTPSSGSPAPTQLPVPAPEVRGRGE